MRRIIGNILFLTIFWVWFLAGISRLETNEVKELFFDASFLGGILYLWLCFIYLPMLTIGPVVLFALAIAPAIGILYLLYDYTRGKTSKRSLILYSITAGIFSYFAVIPSFQGLVGSYADLVGDAPAFYDWLIDNILIIAPLLFLHLLIRITSDMRKTND